MKGCTATTEAVASDFLSYQLRDAVSSGNHTDEVAESTLRSRWDNKQLYFILNNSRILQADEAFRLGPPPSRESYLRAEAIVEIARKTGAQVRHLCLAVGAPDDIQCANNSSVHFRPLPPLLQAIHPGYGFLSENEAFSRMCATEGIEFIGG